MGLLLPHKAPRKRDQLRHNDNHRQAVREATVCAQLGQGGICRLDFVAPVSICNS